MRPFTVLIGTVLGLAPSTTFRLALAPAIVAILAGRHPSPTREPPRVPAARTSVAGLTAPGAGSFPGRLAAASLLLALAGCAGTHKAGPAPSTDIDDVAFREDLRRLASDELEGRRPGTSGEEKTIAFLSGEFRKLGLRPVSGESFVQAVPLIESTPVAPPTVRVGGRTGVPALAYGRDVIVWSPRAESETRLVESALVFVGYGIVAPELGWNDYAGLDVHGKTVLVLEGDPGPVSGDASLFKGNALSLYGRTAYKLEEAARQGAAGVLLVHDDRMAGYGWQAELNGALTAQLQPADAQESPGLTVAGWLSSTAGGELLAAGGVEAGGAAAVHRGFRPVPLGLALDVSMTSRVRRFSSANVVAMLPGGERRQEYVLFTAHWDHLGRASDGTIYPGAVDDASGVAGLLALAQSFARTRPPPDRSLLFIAFGADETRLLGARYYVEHPVVPLGQTAAVLCLEELRLDGRTRDMFVVNAGNSELEEYARGTALLQGRVTRPDPRPEAGLFYRTDAIEFALHGVPALYASSGIDDAARGPGYGQAQLDEYYARRFRTPQDRYSDALQVQGAVEDLSLYYSVGLHVADMRRFPRWYPTSDFSASHRRARAGG